MAHLAPRVPSARSIFATYRKTTRYFFINEPFQAMNHRSLRTLIFAFFLATPLLLAGCDSSGSNESEPDPSFDIATTEATLQGGTAGIQFFATPSENVELVEVEIDPPAGSGNRFNLGSETYLGDQSFALQASGTAYQKVSGEWSFTFKGTKAGGSEESFEVTETVNVSA